MNRFGLSLAVCILAVITLAATAFHSVPSSSSRVGSVTPVG